jgi:hypothetical protein
MFDARKVDLATAVKEIWQIGHPLKSEIAAIRSPRRRARGSIIPQGTLDKSHRTRGEWPIWTEVCALNVGENEVLRRNGTPRQTSQKSRLSSAGPMASWYVGVLI